MGLFSKDKKTDLPAPPMPGAPANPGAAPMPGVPSVADPMAPQTLSAPVAEKPLPDGINLTPPSLPGGSLEEIKNQVVGSEPEGVGELEDSQDDLDNESFDKNRESFNSSDISTDEDLFNMFKVDDEDLSYSQSSLPSAQNSDGSIEETGSPSLTNHSSESHPDDTTIGNSTELNFKTMKIKAPETQFLTTTQFKALLEVVDSVKEKIKLSTETHLRIMDMKAEEDVEYESLRKNFQFIEDKLYDLDSILFEK